MDMKDLLSVDNTDFEHTSAKSVTDFILVSYYLKI